MNTNLKFIVALSYFIASVAFATESYVIPPTSLTHSYVPVISDVKMEQCVKLYNETEWLIKKIDTTHVDHFSQQSIDNYNAMINKHTKMTKKFNAECAGKQSRSACEAARKLNLEQGLPYQEC